MAVADKDLWDILDWEIEFSAALTHEEKMDVIAAMRRAYNDGDRDVLWYFQNGSMRHLMKATSNGIY
jgi:hypothetical protein